MSNYSYPLFDRISIECNSYCNRDCSFCTRTYDNREKVRMPLSLIYKVLKDLNEGGFKGLISFHFYNEIFTDNRIFEIFEKCKELGLNNYLVTNGDLLTKEKVKKLSRYNIREFTLSLYDSKDREDFEERAQQYIEHYQLDAYGWELIILNGGEGFTNRAGYVDHVEEKVKLPVKSSCSKIVKKVDVRYDGEVVMCCLDYYGLHSIGNINNQNIIDIWHSEKKRHQLIDLAKGNRYKYELCSRCSDYMIDV
ncbi:radical SAM protein [Carboxylicivirga sp. N1Y90]|uniref:radical SAM protein n=1 Tax=Carboxylicivirga fragile TaxID=3417571 RepID=UPI003D34BF64|nr:SPASM domain-containing protein [Marinilabiliaceae bacterium N1Y90]